MKAILKREFKSYFQNVIGWLYIAATLALYGLYFFANNLSYGYPKIAYSLSAITFLVFITVPVLTMRSLAEEQKSKTDQLILTSPVSVGRIVLAKYLAMALIHTMVMIVIAVTPLILRCFGTVPLAESYVAILGFWLYGLTCIAIGVFVSSLTESQVIAAVLTFAFLFVGYMMQGITGLISSTGNVLTKILSCYDLLTPLTTFFEGCLSVTGIIYYVSVSALFLFLASQSIQKRRWSIRTSVGTGENVSLGMVRRKKIKTGVFSAGFVALAVVFTVVINLFAAEIPSTYTSIDMTSSKLYSLTEDTKTFLKELDKDVEIYIIASKEDVDTTVAETLNRFEDSTEHITVEYKDPAVNPNFYQTYTDENISVGSLIVSCGDVSKVIDYNDLFESTIDYTTYSQQTTGYDGEGQLVSALQYVSSDSMPVIYEIQGHGETALSGNFSEAVEKANVTLKSINLLETEIVPEDAQAVIINGPVSDFSEDDANKIITYMQGGGNVFITTDYQAEGEMPNFSSILAEYELSLVKGVVAEGDAQMYYQNPFYLLPEVASSTYTSSVGSNYVFVPFAQAINYPESTEDITYTALLTTSEDAVAKSDTANATTYAYEDGDEKGTFSLAVAAEKTIDEETTGRLVVFGSKEVFTDNADAMVSKTNSGMFADILSNFVNTDGMTTIVIPVKSYDMSQLTVPMFTAAMIGISIILLIPLLCLISGIVVWMKRRKR